MKTKLLECENNKLRKEKEAALLLANEKKKELAKLNEELKDFKELQEKVVSFQSSISKFTTEPVKRNENSNDNNSLADLVWRNLWTRFNKLVYLYFVRAVNIL